MDVLVSHISWRMFCDDYEIDEKLQGIFSKAPKLTYKAAQYFIWFCKIFYLLEQLLMGQPQLHFLIFSFQTIISHFRYARKFCNNSWFFISLPICSKTSFRVLPCVTKHRSHALVTTVRATSRLITDLPTKNRHKFVLTNRFKTDPNDRHFIKYRQMTGGHFFLWLHKVETEFSGREYLFTKR